MSSGSLALPACPSGCPGKSPAQPTPQERRLWPCHRIWRQEPLAIVAWCLQPPAPRTAFHHSTLSAGPGPGPSWFPPMPWHQQTQGGLCHGVCQPRAATSTPVTWHSCHRVRQLPAQLGAGLGCQRGHRQVISVDRDAGYRCGHGPGSLHTPSCSLSPGECWRAATGWHLLQLMRHP